MSSFIRRIIRQQHASRKIHRCGRGALYANPPRKIFFKGRGSKLGVTNPQAEDLLARLAREARRASL